MPRRLPPRLDENRKRLPHILKDVLPPKELEEQGLCHGSPVDFYSKDPLIRKVAMGMCETCPVRRACLDWALWSVQTTGIFGGRSEMEIRRALSVDEHGRYRFMRREMRCPNCKNRDLVVSARRYVCKKCDQTWPVIRPKRGQEPPPWWVRAEEKAREREMAALFEGAVTEALLQEKAARRGGRSGPGARAAGKGKAQTATDV